MKLIDVGEPCTLADCPPGPFRTIGSDPGYGFKTEYGGMEVVGNRNVPGPDLRWRVGSHPDVYVLASGESWWGGHTDRASRDAEMVQPMAMEAS